jgi:outer membrane protein, heavy metal efflux system
MVRVALILVLALVACPRAFGQESASVVTLLGAPEPVVEWVARRSAEVRAARERVAQASAEVRQSALWPNPQLSFEAGTLALPDTNPPGLSLAQTSHFSVGIGETFELGKRGPRTRAAELRHGASREELLATLGKRAAEARVALGRVAYLGAKQSALEENLANARRVVDLERARRDAGDISDTEWQRIVLDTQTVELDVARNQSDMADALADCRAALEAVCDADGARIELLDAAAPVPGAVPEPPPAPDLAARADVRALRLERDAASSEAALARRRAIPDPQISLTYTHDNLTVAGNQPNALTVDVGLPLPIFDTGRHDAARAEAHARELEAQAVAATVAAQGDVAGLAARGRFLDQAIARLETDAVPRSQRVVEATRKAYDSGHLSLSDLLLTERTHRELVIRLIDLRFERFSAKNQLRQALGLDAELARARDLQSLPGGGS